jgi:hypothetical protein
MINIGNKYKSGHMIYIGETISSNCHTHTYDIADSLYKGELYWIDCFSYNNNNNIERYFIYRKEYDGNNNDVQHQIDSYIGCNNIRKDVSNHFIPLAEFREQQIKSILDE